MTLLVHLGWKVIELFWRRNRSQSSIHHRREREQNCTHSTPAKGEERKKNQIKSTRLLAPSLLWRVLFLIFPDRIQSSLDQSCFNFPPAPRPLSGDTRAPQAAGRAADGPVIGGEESLNVHSAWFHLASNKRNNFIIHSSSERLYSCGIISASYLSLWRGRGLK